MSNELPIAQADEALISLLQQVADEANRRRVARGPDDFLITTQAAALGAIKALASRPSAPVAPALEEMLLADHKRMRAAGTALAEAALRVIRESDGLHRLSLAVAEWAKAVANEGGRSQAPAPQPQAGMGAGEVEAWIEQHQRIFWTHESQDEAGKHVMVPAEDVRALARQLSGAQGADGLIQVSKIRELLTKWDDECEGVSTEWHGGFLTAANELRRFLAAQPQEQSAPAAGESEGKALPNRAPETFREAVRDHFPAVDPDWMWKVFAPVFEGAALPARLQNQRAPAAESKAGGQ